MSETNQKRLAAVRESHDRRKRRLRSAALHIALTDAERDEFRKLCEEHGMLDRELLMNSIRAFKTLGQRVELLEAKVTLLDAYLKGTP